MQKAARSLVEREIVARDGGAHNCVDQMLTRKDLYATIDYEGFEALDATIVKTVVPEAMSQ